ncbi:MAG: hypothetical protein IJY28_02360 [Clostridia bacterium]|nr:hypothetical protein [Clostridia bacterium]
MDSELLKNLTSGDPEAFQQFYDQYSLPVYRYILDRTGDAERTHRLWQETFRSLPDLLQNTTQPDPMLLLLTVLADRRIDLLNAIEAFHVSEVVPDSVQKRAASRRTGLIILLVGLILVGILALWVATGFLMALDVLPAYDWGYSWFNRVFFRLFPSSFP